MIRQIPKSFARVKTLVFAFISIVGLSFACSLDYIFRHEETRQAKIELREMNLEPTADGLIQAVRQGKLALFDNYDTAGISFGSVAANGLTPLHAAIISQDSDAIDQVLVRSREVSETIDEATSDGMTPLKRALEAKDFTLANRLVKQLGANINIDKEPGLPYLISAIQEGDAGIPLRDYLLDLGVDVNRTGEQPHSALVLAADQDDVSLMRRLITQGASIAQKGISEKPLLMEAAHELEYEEVALLLEKGADVEERYEGVDLLSLALQEDDGHLTHLAIEADANLDRKGASDEPLIIEAINDNAHDWLLTLLDQGVSIETQSTAGDSLLMTAAKTGNYEMVDFLIARGADVNAKNKDGLTPLGQAIEAGDTALVRTLVENRAEIFPEPMFTAAYRNRDNPTMSLLLNAGVSPEIKLEGSDKRIMDAAVEDGAVETVQTLISMGTDIGDNLWGAIITGQDSLVEVILGNGADPKQKGPNGEDPLEYVLNEKRFSLLKPLLAAGADPNPMFDARESWVSRAIRSGQKDAALSLIDAGAKIGDGRCLDGQSMLGWSIGREMYDVTKALLANGADPNIQEPSPCNEGFIATFDESSTFRRALKYDSKMRPLMMAAVKRNHDVAQALVKAGAKNLTSRRYLYPVAIGAWYNDVKMMQICYGRDPNHQPRKIIVDLSDQRVSYFENGTQVYSSVCSTGKSGYRTQPGTYVITQKSKDHISSIYGSPMPYFMRVSCRDFGIHVGNCPGYPASHGCVRVPWNAAKYYYGRCSLGDMVIIQR